MGQSRKDKLLRLLQARLGPDGKPRSEYRESVAQIRAELGILEDMAKEAANASGTDAG